LYSSSDWRSCAAYVVGPFVPSLRYSPSARACELAALRQHRPESPHSAPFLDDAEKAAHLRQPLLSRHFPAQDVFPFTHHKKTSSRKRLV